MLRSVIVITIITACLLLMPAFSGNAQLPSPVYARVRLVVGGKPVTKEATIIGTQPVKTHSIKPLQRKKIYWQKELEGAKKP